jgi:hypothetical protein
LKESADFHMKKLVWPTKDIEKAGTYWMVSLKITPHSQPVRGHENWSTVNMICHVYICTPACVCLFCWCMHDANRWAD